MDILKVKMDARFSMYSKDGEMLVSPVIYKDSLSWENVRQGDRSLTKDFPSREQALKLSVLDMADKMVRIFVPYWEKQYRWYYTDEGKTKMKKAQMKAGDNEWKEAAVIWGNLFEEESSDKKKAKLASNIALANEMLDDVENALNWADISYGLFTKTMDKDSEDVRNITVYKNELQRRLKDFELFGKQEEVDAGSDE